MTLLKKPQKQLEWTERAAYDRLKIHHRIAVDDFNPINASLVDGRIFDALDFLSNYPLAGTVLTKTLYSYPVRKTQLTIVYKLGTQKLTIARITHQKRKNI